MAAYRRVDDLTVICRLTACTPGSAPGPTLGIEYGKPLPLPFTHLNIVTSHTRVQPGNWSLTVARDFAQAVSKRRRTEEGVPRSVVESPTPDRMLSAVESGSHRATD